MAVVEVTSRLTNDEPLMRNERSMPKLGLLLTLLCKRERGGSGEGKVVVDSAEPFRGQRAEDIVERASKNAETHESPQEGEKAGVHGFYYRRVLHGNKVVDCPVLREINLTAWEVLSHNAVNRKINELENQERRVREVLASPNEELKSTVNEQ